MADNSIFQSLRNGINFKQNRYSKDINKFKGITSHDLDKTTNKSIHFFKTNNKIVEKPQQSNIKEETKKSENKEKDEEEEEEEEVNNEEDDDYIEEDDDNKENNEEIEEEEKEDIKIFSKSKPQDEDEEEENEEIKKKQSKMTKEQRHQMEMNKIRNRNRIKVEGTDIPDPLTDFEQLYSRFKVKKYLCRNISDLKYQEPSPIQMQTIPILLKEREVLGIAPTGSGKTAAFTIPILQTLRLPSKDGFRAVIIAPTRELAQQIYRNFKLFSKSKPFRICVLSKNIHQKNDDKIIKNFDILITTPLRLVYLIKESNITLNRVEFLVFDEADKLFDRDFLEQVDSVVDACQNSKLKIALFSATMNTVVENMAKSIMKNPIKVVIGEENAASHTINQHLIYVGKEDGKIQALRQLIQKGLEPPILIFVQSKERAHDLFQELIFDGINVDVIHSDRTQFQRDTIVKKFRTGKIWVLICTELMARGMDFKGVNFVINFDFPQTLASYVHRIGRTGRAGKPGTAYTFFTESDQPMLPTIAQAMKKSGSEIPEWMNNLKTSQKDKFEFKKKGVNRDSISTMTSNEKSITKFRGPQKKRTFDNLKNDQISKDDNNNNNNNNNNSTKSNSKKIIKKHKPNKH
ncbi:putative RNA helicase [Tieghemostelium lacteum]|uniref:RNA helicase n=1 Tax=Tieghemostelium lacteum TaxID=361077 RepID=A0A151Z6E8_TIELA|nr:putative RNA helicase [Tieghemostelium lacteum]|eukprot:KYQ89533.1 putative RNA helicase [Tieghemostelium lacteum]